MAAFSHVFRTLKFSGNVSVALKHSTRHYGNAISNTTLCHTQPSGLPGPQFRIPAHFLQVRHMSNGRKGFLQGLFDNIKEELSKNKDMKDQIKKFREESKKFEESEAVKSAREKFNKIESESVGTIKKGFDAVKEKMDEVSSTQFAAKAGEISQEVTKAAKAAADAVSKVSEEIGKSKAFQEISQGAKSVKQEFDEVTNLTGTYRRPVRLLKRSELIGETAADGKTIEANTQDQGVVLHKDSKWYKTWSDFKDNNPYINKMFDLKMKFDESDNIGIRAVRVLTDRLTSMFGGMFTKTELSDVLTEISKIDPTFSTEQFLQDLQQFIIPNILEAMVRGDFDVLRDWCTDAPYSQVSTPHKQAMHLGLKIESRVLDIDHLDLVGGKMMEQGPVLVVMFFSQQVMAVRDKQGNVVEGDANKVLRIQYVWALCRDQAVMNPKAAWRLLEFNSAVASV